MGSQVFSIYSDEFIFSASENKANKAGVGRGEAELRDATEIIDELKMYFPGRAA